MREFFCSYCQKHKRINLLAERLGKGKAKCKACAPNIKPPALKTEVDGINQLKEK